MILTPSRSPPIATGNGCPIAQPREAYGRQLQHWLQSFVWPMQKLVWFGHKLAKQACNHPFWAFGTWRPLEFLSGCPPQQLSKGIRAGLACPLADTKDLQEQSSFRRTGETGPVWGRAKVVSKCPKGGIMGCPGELSVRIQHFRGRNLLPGKVVSIFPCLCCRRHLCKDSAVLLDMQLKPLSQHIALALNRSRAL